MITEGLKAADTNVIVRIIVRDDPDQITIIDALLEQSLFVPITVLLETVWVLSSRYRMQRRDIADAMENLLDLPAIVVDEPDLILWALGRFRNGADFADMLHLIVSRETEGLVTFDKGMPKAAAEQAPVPIITLRA
ncbi:type II toxin-antitoxin system VapC family toxin [Sphingosinicella terrae]|uniref:type II toxin-antitoxin system VapC family toxin n=1 Tax=Sphingosinicella terrae TaxID=2172047 RepID=UPI0013B41051|nr:type II toxin-antitoxin system VapC family toxin [Sphingosinicella terrae]